MTYNVVKVPRAPLTVCLQCPLCCDLIHGATTISECLHTFCRDCIYEKLGDGETDWCPICNVNLGCSPLEKLRADHQLDDICAKIFPLKIKKRKAIDSIAEVAASSPVRRKERSLSSLGIGAAPTAVNVNQNRKTKNLSRRSVMIRDTSMREFESGKVDRSSSELRGFEAGKDLSESDNSAFVESENADGMAASISDEKDERFADEKSAILSHEKRWLNEMENLQKGKRARVLKVKRTTLSNRGIHEAPPGDITRKNYDSTKLGMYVSEMPKSFSTDMHQKQLCLDASEHGDASSFRSQDSPPQERILAKKRIAKKVPKNRSTLAHLAEIVVDHGGELCSSPKRLGHHWTKTQAVRSHRNRGKRNTLRTMAIGMNLNSHPAGDSLHESESQQHAKLPSLKKNVAGLNKLTVPRIKTSSAAKRTSAQIIPAPKRDRSQVGLWFALEAAENQSGENALPQIANHYLRIKNGKLPVSVVKKYLVKKLDLRNESEVEITCRGQPVVPSLPLESVQGIWFATAPPTDSAMSLMKANVSSKNEINWMPIGGSSAKEYMMVLTYGRNRRSIISQ